MQANQPRRFPAFDGIAMGSRRDAGTTGRPAISFGTFSPDAQQRARRLAGRALAGLAIATLLFVVVIVGFRVAYGGKVYPAISTAGIQLGGMPRAEAEAAVTARTQELNDQTVLFTFEDQVFRPTLSELGVSFDVDRTLAEAYAYGREEGAVERLRVAGGLLREDHTVPLYATIDYGVMDRWFDQVDSTLGLIPHDAYLVVDGTTVTVEPEVEGTVVDRDAARAQIAGAVANLTENHTTLPVVAWIPNVRAGDLDGVRSQVESALSEPVELSFGDQEWTVQPDELSQFIIQDNDKSKVGADAVSVRLDETALAEYLSVQYAAEIYLEPVNATIGWNQGPVALTASVDGHELRPQDLAQQVADSFFGGHPTVDVPVNVIAPAVDSDNLAALNMTTRLGRGDSNYVGSDYGRATNLTVGANLLNGTLVAPGATFSFNHSIGIISTELGFVEARVIEAERIGRGIGGGICQVSTTVFRAALLAGLPVEEWWPHAQRIEFYERDGWGPGYDASILQPDYDPMSGGDFKFSNPTDGWLLIESFVDGSHIIVNIYGPDTGWNVTVTDAVQSDPIQPEGDIEVVNWEMQEGCVVHSEAPRTGLVVYFSRSVADKDGNVLREVTFETVFKANGNVYVVAPDQQGNSPASGGWNVGNCDFSAIPA